MKIIDLTHVINEDMPVYTGTEKPLLRAAATLKENGYRETVINICSHVGTHMDAPRHIFDDGKSLELYDISCFTGSAFTIDCRMPCECGEIDIGILKQWEDKISEVDFVLLCTGWSKYWGESKYFEGYPVLSEAAVKYLSKYKLKGIGIDAISVDSIENGPLPNHCSILAKDAVIIENLKCLEETIGRLFTLWSLPLKYSEADGAPARAAAVLHNADFYSNLNMHT